jgi:hypothetical protein
MSALQNYQYFQKDFIIKNKKYGYIIIESIIYPYFISQSYFDVPIELK